MQQLAAEDEDDNDIVLNDSNQVVQRLIKDARKATRKIMHPSRSVGEWWNSRPVQHIANLNVYEQPTITTSEEINAGLQTFTMSIPNTGSSSFCASDIRG